MAYRIDVWYNDPGIETTRISGDGFYRDGRYGDPHYEATYSEELTFEAVEAAGYYFYRWVYRFDSSHDDVHYSYENPFSYSGGANGSEGITIRAESTTEPPAQRWQLRHRSLGTLSSTISRYEYMEPRTLVQLEARFLYKGRATIYSTGSYDTVGYISESADWDNETGRPKSFIDYNDDGSNVGNNFVLSVPVEAGKTYYIYVRGFDDDLQGGITVYIEPPSGAGEYGTGGIYVFTGGRWEKAVPYVRRGSSWQQAEPALYTLGGWKQEI